MDRSKRNRKRKAFTLLEILIVITLMAFLAAIAVNNVGSIMSGGQRKIAETFVKNSLDSPLMAYRMAVGSYPSTEEGLMALIKAPESAGERWGGPYLRYKELPVDPWGTPYQYRFPGIKNPESFDVWSLGPDKVESDDDIGNW